MDAMERVESRYRTTGPLKVPDSVSAKEKLQGRKVEGDPAPALERLLPSAKDFITDPNKLSFSKISTDGAAGSQASRQTLTSAPVSTEAASQVSADSHQIVSNDKFVALEQNLVTMQAKSEGKTEEEIAELIKDIPAGDMRELSPEMLEDAHKLGYACLLRTDGSVILGKGVSEENRTAIEEGRGKVRLSNGQVFENLKVRVGEPGELDGFIRTYLESQRQSTQSKGTETNEVSVRSTHTVVTLELKSTEVTSKVTITADRMVEHCAKILNGHHTQPPGMLQLHGDGSKATEIAKERRKEAKEEDVKMHELKCGTHIFDLNKLAKGLSTIGNVKSLPDWIGKATILNIEAHHARISSMRLELPMTRIANLSHQIGHPDLFTDAVLKELPSVAEELPGSDRQVA